MRVCSYKTYHEVWRGTNLHDPTTISMQILDLARASRSNHKPARHQRTIRRPKAQGFVLRHQQDQFGRLVPQSENLSKPSKATNKSINMSGKGKGKGGRGDGKKSVSASSKAGLQVSDSVVMHA